MLTDGVVKQFSTATVEIDMLFYKGHATALCMDNPVQDVIIGNIPGALGLRQHNSDSTEVMVRCEYIPKITSGSQDHTTTAVGTKEVCDRSQCIRIRLFVQQNKQEIHMNKIAIEPDKQGTAVH